MATVTSLTQAKIEELMEGWQAVGITQEVINALVLQLQTNMEANSAAIQEFNDVTLPKLQEDLAEGANRVSELNDTTLPNLEADLTQARAELDTLSTVTLPSIQEDIFNTVQNVEDRPKVYVQDEAPENPDEDDRYLVVGDVWHDSNDNNRQRIWNGVEWSTFNVDVADFTLTARSFLSTRHQLY